MDDPMASLGAFVGLIVVFLVVLSILWIILPFAVFGVKPRLDAIKSAVEENTKPAISPRQLEHQCAQIAGRIEDLYNQTLKLSKGLDQVREEIAKSNQILCAVHRVKFDE